MSRPSHAIQQQGIEDMMATPTSGRWRWLFTPDPRWLNVVNTTALRTVNAIRMFIAVTVLFLVMECGVVFYALTRCGIYLRMFGVTVFQLLPPPGKLSVGDWRLCEESLATARMLDFASSLFNSYGLLLAAMAGIALGAMGIKRATDTEHRVEVEKAKKAPIIMPQTSEHQAQAPVKQEVNITTGPVETVEQSGAPEEPPAPGRAIEP